MGFGLGQIHLNMKPDYLFNHVWWEERPETPVSNMSDVLLFDETQSWSTVHTPNGSSPTITTRY